MTPSPTSPDSPGRWQRLKGTINRVKEWISLRRGLRIAGLALSTAGGAVLPSLLVAAVRAVFVHAAGQKLRVAGLVVCVVLLSAGVVGLHNRGRPVHLSWLILAAWGVAAGLVAALTGLAWLLLDTPRWTPPTTLTPKALDSIATRAFAVVAGPGGAAPMVPN